jgi:DNA invertase Pin-like site-specific DNA recombinase
MAKMIVPCDDRCMFAKGDDCDCECEGRNHKQGHRMTPAQRAIVKTASGRRIKPILKNDPDYARARRAEKLRKSGATNKAIAEELGVSAPTVRRLLRRIVMTEAMAKSESRGNVWSPSAQEFVA